ncbi:MAG: hypothetical protein JSR39_10450 [Verrucomicrobia bacterium]|nr:hypothetical protein [Verrucomicrobiota bacterium]
MTSTLHSDQIRGLKIFDSASQPLKLCRSHQEILRDDIATDVNDLVRSSFFREKFRDLFPADRTGAHFNIRLTDHSLIVQLMREDDSGRRLNPEGQALAIDLSAPDNEEVIEINTTILDKADAIYQECQNEHIRSHRTTVSHPLRSRDVSDLRHVSEDDLRDELEARRRYRRPDLTRVSEDDLRDELDARRSYRRSEPRYDREPAYRRTRSDAPDRAERRTRTSPSDTPSDSLRRARELQLDLQLQADRLSRSPTMTIDQLAPLHEQIRRLEQQIQRLSEQLGSPVATTVAASSDPSPVLERINERLGRIEERLNRLENPGTAASTTLSTDRPETQDRTADLSRRIDDLTHRNEELASQLSSMSTPSPTLPHLSNEQFETMTALAKDLDAPSVRGDEDFPFGKDTLFMDFPEPVRDSVYFQMYTLCNPSRVPDIWRCGEKFFLNKEGLHSNNNLRSLAITRYQLQSLGNEFAILGKAQAPSAELLARFTQLPQIDQIGVLRQLQFLRRQSHEELDVTLNSFLGRSGTPTSNEERNEAISRYLQAQITDRYGNELSDLSEELQELSEELEATKLALREAEDRHRLELQRLRTGSHQAV